MTENESGKKQELPETTKRIDELDAHKYAAMNADMKFLLQSLECLNLKKQIENLKLQNTQLSAKLNIGSLDTMLLAERAKIEELNPKYNKLMKEIAEKYGIEDPGRMAIDEVKGTIREIPVPSGG